MTRRLAGALVGAGLLAALLAGLAPTAGAATAPWEHYILAPASRTVAPTAVLRTQGTVSGAQNLISGGSTRLSGNGSYVVLDFGREVGGLVTLHFAGASDSSQQVGLAFSESSLNVGTASDASNGGPGADGAITASVSGPGSYTMPAASLRGGFRYLTLFLNSSGWVDIDQISLHFTAAPAMVDPRAYPDYFYSSDDLLNRIWYAGAYTIQMDTIAPDEGRVWGPPASGWNNSGVIGVGTSVLADGAKRDRTVWPGDLGISVPTDYVAFDDMATVRNSLTTLYEHQDPDGALPYAGPEVNFPGELSDAYHMWSLIGTADYYLYSADKAWLDGIWAQYQKGVSWVTDRIDPSTGLFYVAGSADWARSDQGKENLEANVLLYRVLVTAAQLATAEGNGALASQYSGQATALARAINQQLWDPAAGAYRDNSSSTLYPQDGNSLAVWFGVVDSPAKTTAILSYLKTNWKPYGAHTPEWTGIHPFPGSMEIQARLAAGDDEDALTLIRREWGYMLNSPIGTGSTFWEGYNDDGSFAYESTGKGYTSLAHGWATGPTSALTFYVLGIAPDDANGRYHFVPHPADLSFAQGRITLPAGPLTASWRRDASQFTMQLTAPSGTTGEVGVPISGATDRITVNGKLAWNGSSTGAFQARSDGRYVYFAGLTGSSYTIVSSPPPGVLGPGGGVGRGPACTSRRTIRLHVRLPRGSRVRATAVTVAGHRQRRAATTSRRGLTATIRLSGYPRSTVPVLVTVRLRSGRTLRVRRTFHTCAAARRPAKKRSHTHLEA